MLLYLKLVAILAFLHGYFAEDIHYLIPKYCNLQPLNVINMGFSENDSSIILKAYMHEGLKYESLDCYVIVKTPADIGIVLTVNKILINANDTLLFRSGSNPPRVWSGVEEIEDEIVAEPAPFGESDIMIQLKSRDSQSQFNAGFSLVLTTFRAPTVQGCLESQFDCGNGRCIFANLECNELNNCGNNEDEDECWTGVSIWIIVLLFIICILVVALAIFVWIRMGATSRR